MGVSCIYIIYLEGLHTHSITFRNILLLLKIFLFGLKTFLSFPRRLNSQLLPFLLLVTLVPCYLEAGFVYVIMEISLKSGDMVKNCGVGFSANLH